MSGIRESNPIRSVSAAPAADLPPEPASPRQVAPGKEPGQASPHGPKPTAPDLSDFDGAGATAWVRLPERREWLLPMLLGATFRLLLCMFLAASLALTFVVWKNAGSVSERVETLSKLPSRLATNDAELERLSKNVAAFSEKAQAQQAALGDLRTLFAELSQGFKGIHASNSELIRLREKLDRLQVPAANLRIEPSAVMIIALHSRALPQDKYLKLYKQVLQGLPRVGDHLVGLTIFTTSAPRVIVALGKSPAECDWQTRLPTSDDASENLKDAGEELAGLFENVANARRLVVVGSAECRPPGGPVWQSYSVDALLMERKNVDLSEWAAFCGQHRGTLSVVQEGNLDAFAAVLRRLTVPEITAD